MDACFEFKIEWFDEQLMQVRVTASNGKFSGTTAFYGAPDEHLQLAKALKGFPSSKDEVRYFELGEFGEVKFGGVKGRISQLDSTGHCKLELEINSGDFYGRSAEVFLPKSLQETTLLGVFSVPSLAMFAAAAASYFTTKPVIHAANDFNFGPVKEVGYLFVGIFLTMIPALQILQSGEAVQISSPMQYYFATGTLSAFLDNAPTYLSFLAASMGKEHLSVDSPADVITFAATHAPHLVAISLGAVFFGAGSYIGNGPNFMVKAIADKSKVHAPSFLAYLLRFSIPILLPILMFVGWVMVKNAH